MLDKKVIILALFAFGVAQVVRGQSIASTFAKQYLIGEIENLVKNLDHNNTCVRHLFRVGQAVRNKEIWALRVLDSFSKLNPGLLDGNIVNLGSFDECIDLENKDNDFKGQYCTYAIQVQLPIPPDVKGFDQMNDHLQSFKYAREMNISGIPMGGAVCVPHVCTVEDLRYIYDTSGLRNRYPNVSVAFHQDLCYTKPGWFEGWGWIKWFGMSYFLFHLLLMLMSSCYDLVLRLLEKKPLHDILLIYSIPKNLKSLFTVREKSNEEIRCIQGLRALSMLWIILGHRFILTSFHPNLNTLYIIKDWIYSDTSSLIFSGHLSVDTFFFISGVLIFYLYFLAESQGARFNIIGYYIHRYIRLTPSVAALIILSISFYEDLANGPFWKVITYQFTNPCFENWWPTLLYYQNLQSSEKLCMSHTWYLGADTQLYAIAPIFFLTLTRWPRAVLSMMGVLIFTTSGLAFWKAWDQSLAISILNIEDEKTWVLYSQTQYRAAVWFMGAILGYYLSKTRDVIIKIPKWVNALVWTGVIFMMCFIIYLSHLLQDNDYQREIHSFVHGFIRVFWGIGLSWITFTCYHELGGFIDRFLSCKFFVIIGRLTFSMYIVHIHTLIITLGTARTTGYFSNVRCITAFWGDLVNTTIIGIIWNLAFEAPLRNFSNILLRKHVRQLRSKNSMNGANRNSAEI